MGKRKRVQKHLKESKNEEKPCSSSSLRPETEESKNPPSGAQTVDKEANSINDLPPEVLTEILKCVDVPSLFACRLVNVKWNEISSGILWTRPKTDFWFSFHGTRFFSKCQKKDSKALRSLRDFLDCMKNTRNCPFARFDFQVVSQPQEGVFQHKEWFEFLADFGHFSPEGKAQKQNENQNQKTRIKFLGMHFHNFGTEKTFLNLNEKLRDLLLNQIPNVEELRLIYPKTVTGDPMEIPFFPSPPEDGASVSVPVPAQLAHLKVIYFEQSIFKYFPQIPKDLLNAAVHLKKIHFQKFDEADFRHFECLVSLQKHFLIQNCTIKLTNEFLLLIKREDQKQNPWMLQFEELELKIDANILRSGSNSSALDYAANFISRLFESTKNTLRKLKMTSIGILTGVQFPRFKNLVELELLQRQQIRNGPFLPIFPGGVRSLEIFPVVRFLDFEFYNWRDGFPQEDSIPVLPNVKSLRVPDWKLGENGISISILASMCPNLKHFEIFRDGQAIPFLEMGRAIWTHMNKLESLEVAVDVHSADNDSIALDSCLTGISVNNCRRLRDLKEADRLLEKWGSQTRVLESELKAATEREHPSILDMKELKKLSINLFSGWHPLKKSEFMSNFSWISREHAFKKMPHLFQME